MTTVKTLNNISQIGLDSMPNENYQIGDDIDNPDVILVRSAKMFDMEIGSNLKAVGRAGAGVNNIPIDKLSERGVVVFNTPGANANAVKELVISSMFLASRNICQAWNYVNELPLDNLKTAVEDGKKQYAGSELPGKTLGIIGLGAIGVQIANAAYDLDMNVVGFDPHITVKNAWKLSSEIKLVETTDELFSQSNFISFHVPLIDSTKNLLNKRTIDLLPDGAVIMNFARDGIVDEEALKVALDSGKVRYYVTDFPIDAMKNHDRVIALPHLGASTAEAEDSCATMVSKQVMDYIEHGYIKNSVNFPRVKMPDAGKSRLAINHKNIPNMVVVISTILADSGENIIDMLNKSMGDYAYTLIDLEYELTDAALMKLQQAEGILMVRKIY